MAKHLSASDVADSFKTDRYWRLMERVQDANRKGQSSREQRALADVQDELHKSWANERAGRMIHK